MGERVREGRRRRSADLASVALLSALCTPHHTPVSARVHAVSARVHAVSARVHGFESRERARRQRKRGAGGRPVVWRAPAALPSAAPPPT
eukprot:3871568-Rhodomonas_salina.3